jgi:hypothetical protein
MGLTRSEAASMWSLCKVLASTPVFAPPMQGNPGVVMGVALYLHGFGIPISLPTLKKVHVWEEPVKEQVNGQWQVVGTKICMQEDYRLLLGLLHTAGHDCWLETLDDEKCTFVFVHRDHPGREQRFTFTMKMAARAGLDNKPNWKKNPHWMLPAAAVRMCARLGAPEVLLGLDIAGEEGRPVIPVMLSESSPPPPVAAQAPEGGQAAQAPESSAALEGDPPPSDGAPLADDDPGREF